MISVSYYLAILGEEEKRRVNQATAKLHELIN